MTGLLADTRRLERGAVAALVVLAASGSVTDARGKESAQSRSEWVQPGRDGRLIYKTTPEGDRILDFSHAGYLGGGVALPTVKVARTVEPSGGDDDTTVIQSAIDEVSARPLVRGFRGAVLLRPGTYRLPRPVSIAASGVVLRGSGSQPGPKRSTLELTGKPHAAILARLPGGRSDESAGGTPVAITDAYVPSGATSVNVADAAGLSAGDVVLIRKPVTEAWVTFMQMHDLTRNGKPQTWLRPGTTLTTERTIKSIRGKRITLDVPLSDSLDSRHLTPPGPTLVEIPPRERLRQVGIEDLHIQSPPQEISHSQPHFSALRLSAEDAWIRDVVSDETMNSVSIGGRRITLLRVSINRKAKHQGASRPAELAPNGSQILLDRCSVTADNVWFVASGGRHSGPNVVLNSTFTGDSRAESHQRWSTGILYDNCRALEGGIELRNRGSMGSGHGWSMGWGVIWNSQAKDFIVQSPPGALNWMIGSTGESKLAPRPFGAGPPLPEGVKDSPGAPVSPASLYLAQLAERLGPRALRNIGYPPRPSSDALAAAAATARP